MPKLLTSLDLQRNQILNAVSQNLAVEPANPVLGQFYVNAIDGHMYYYNGTRWVAMDSSESAPYVYASMTDGVNTSTANNQSGTFTYTAGAGIQATVDSALDKVTITNTDRGSAQNIFKNVTDGVTTAVASSNNGTLSFAQNGGLTVSVDSTNKRVLYGHADTSTLSNLVETANTFVSGVSFDQYGHVIALDTATVHSQNTDTGTNSATFQIGTSGVKIRNQGGTELQIRNAADTAYADLRLNNLIVEGTQTIINSEIVNIGDSEIELNSDITSSAQNSNGGLSIKRLKADNTTRMDAKITYDESSDRWTTTVGDISGSLVTSAIANKSTAVLGNAINTMFVVTHNLNTRDAIVSIRDNNSPYEQVMTDVEFTTLNTITVYFAVPPEVGRYTISIIG